MSAFNNLSQLSILPMADGIAARAIQSDSMTFAVVELEPHSRVGEHQHPHEQLGLVLRGSVFYTIGGEKKDMRAGDTYLVHANVPHSAEAGSEGAVIVDVFSPVREDWARFTPQSPRASRWP